MAGLHKNKETETNLNQSTRDISIWLDNYDDIFSDFDPRSYVERTLSDDFISELTKVSRESEFDINELRLLLPDKLRNKDVESIISKRLHSFLRKSLQSYLSERKKMIKSGLLFSALGILLLGGAAYISWLHPDRLSNNLLRVILEPAGWFAAWIGFDNLTGSLKKEKREMGLYHKMQKSKILFVSIS